MRKPCVSPSPQTATRVCVCVNCWCMKFAWSINEGLSSDLLFGYRAHHQFKTYRIRVSIN